MFHLGYLTMQWVLILIRYQSEKQWDKLAAIHQCSHKWAWHEFLLLHSQQGADVLPQARWSIWKLLHLQEDAKERRDNVFSKVPAREDSLEGSEHWKPEVWWGKWYEKHHRMYHHIYWENSWLFCWHVWNWPTHEEVSQNSLPLLYMRWSENIYISGATWPAKFNNIIHLQKRYNMQWVTLRSLSWQDV